MLDKLCLLFICGFNNFKQFFLSIDVFDGRSLSYYSAVVILLSKSMINQGLKNMRIMSMVKFWMD